MPADDARCPGCGAGMARVADHGIRYECASCGGRLIGLSPFEQLLPEGVGSKLWVSASLPDAAADGGPCPFCQQPMHRPAPEAGGPAELLMCHTCQQVLLPGGSDVWLADHAARGAALPAPAAAHADQCENCGAPRHPDEDGRCAYCHAQLSDPQPVLINFNPGSGAGGARTGDRLLDGLVGILTRPID